MEYSQVKRVTEYCFSRLRNEMADRPFLLLPVSALEPFGNIPLGAICRLNDTICEELCRRADLFLAPSFAYGYSTPFISFPGCSGLHSATMERSLFDCCSAWFFHGFKRIILVTCSMNGAAGIEPAVQRLNHHRRFRNSVQLFSLQDDIFFRTLCEEKSAVKEVGRNEWGLLVMMEYKHVVSGHGKMESEVIVPDHTALKRWQKCGRDPEKLKKMAPHALFNHPVTGHGDAGRELYSMVINHFQEKITAFLVEGIHAA